MSSFDPVLCGLQISGTYKSPYLGIVLDSPESCPPGHSTFEDIDRFIRDCVGTQLKADGCNDLGCAYAWRKEPDYGRAREQLRIGQRRAKNNTVLKEKIEHNLRILEAIDLPTTPLRSREIEERIE